MSAERVLSATEIPDFVQEAEVEAAETYPDGAGACSHPEGYVRQGFRCDCGTPAMGGSKCYASADAPGEAIERASNPFNRYNDNFREVYCSCKKQYDPQAEEDMLQCPFCEDWFHLSCLLLSWPEAIPKPDLSQQFARIACAACTSEYYPRFLGFVAPVPGLPTPKRVASDDIGPSAKKAKTSTITSLATGASSGNGNGDESSSVTCKYAGTKIEPPPHGLCTCRSCVEFYASSPATDFLLKESEDQSPLEPESDHLVQMDVTSMMRNALRKFTETLMPGQDAALTVAIQAFSEAIRNALAPFADSQQIITEQQMRTITAEAASAAQVALAGFLS
ncbi:uncharacterized protein AMSG_06495 [Thecamonas trahens ATCC 50062]|uniref:Zinc finger PHD-type domain-containing protein n=1 Tax=Thecamonas trahens ATCC 50062 TaxID=461836 RepID=A0A0L0DG33_THETB|nr:hypothetical protein AMSG_06495 [Thecamonas trahens ATCC 50062]KNC51145.1 hypothetical protein AMSG_06495 [Thecamonas trahens ATCC 50062]|eukprot:XP_013756347.1 hypothetical protein AMSG_06495 [Thecamonas trahens ATCC 50062]